MADRPYRRPSRLVEAIWRGRPEAAAVRWRQWAYTDEQALERLRRVERQWTERGHSLCAGHLKHSGEFIGRCGLQYWEPFEEISAGP